MRGNRLVDQLMHFRVAGDDVAAGQVAVIEAEVGDNAAGLLNQQHSGGHIPFMQADFPKPVQSAGGYVGQVQRRRTGPADSRGIGEYGTEHRQISIQVLLFLERETGAQQRTLETALSGNPDAPAVEHRAIAAAGGKQFIAQRIIDHGNLDPGLVLQGDGDGKLREAMEKIGRAIQRVDDPDMVVARMHAAFFCENGMIRKGLVDDLDDFLFRHAVDFRSIIVFAFLVDVQFANIVQGTYQDIAGASRRSDGDVEHWMHRMDCRAGD